MTQWEVVQISAAVAVVFSVLGLLLKESLSCFTPLFFIMYNS